MSLEHTIRDTPQYRAFAIEQIFSPDDHEEKDFGWIHDRLPYSDLNEWVPENGVIQEIDTAFDAHRLSRIKSLSFLSYRMFADGELAKIHDEFKHDRHDHSLVVAMVMEKILTRNGISGRDHTLGMVAAMTHDLATPAGGDAIKFVDPANLHEEDHWREMLTDKSYDFLNKYDIAPEDVEAVIKNEGPLGEILDIADRLTYTAKDVQALLGRRVMPLFENPAQDVERALGHNSQFGNLYRDVLIDQATGRPYINDPSRLEDLLTLRALMHYGLYMSPVSAGRDWVIAKFVEPFYTADQPTKERPLTPQLLRKWTDNDLMRFLSEQYRVEEPHNSFFYNELATWSPSHISFSTQEEAQEHLPKMTPNQIILDTVSRKGFNTGADYLTKNDHGMVVPFKEASPVGTKYLQAISDASAGTHIFYVDESDQSGIGSLVRQQRALGRL